MSSWPLLRTACSALLLALPLACHAPDPAPGAPDGSDGPGSTEPSGRGETGSPPADSANSRSNSLEKVEHQSRTTDTNLEFAPHPKIAQRRQEAGLILLGFRKKDLGPLGMPGAVARPTFEWKQPNRQVVWPVRVQVSLPQDPELRFVAAIDVDGQGRLSPGDHLSAALPLSLGPNETMVFDIDRTLPGPLSGSSRIENHQAGIPPSGPPTEMSSVLLDCNPRIPFLRKSTVMLVGYRSADLEQGIPRSGVPPNYSWRSEELMLTWPLSLQVPLPSNLTLFLILDLDGDGSPSRGDLSSGALVDDQPSREDRELSFLLDQAWWPADPSGATATSSVNSD